MTALEQAVRKVLGQHCGCCQGQGGCTPCTPQARDLAQRIAQVRERSFEAGMDSMAAPAGEPEPDLDAIALAAFTAPRGGDQRES